MKIFIIGFVSQEKYVQITGINKITFVTITHMVSELKVTTVGPQGKAKLF